MRADGTSRRRTTSRASRRTARTASALERGRRRPRWTRRSQHPRCVFQILQAPLRPLHARDGGARSAASRAPTVPAGGGGAVRELGPRAHVGALLRGRLDAAHRRASRYIRTAAILQLLLGNIGRPGGGILALRGHANIQGSTDIPTLYNILPGYLPMPHAAAGTDARPLRRGQRAADRRVGRAATPTSSACSRRGGATPPRPTNDFCFDHLPRIDGDHSHLPDDRCDARRRGEGLLRRGPEPGRRARPTRALHRQAMAKLDWLVVRDLVEIETAAFWNDGPEIETGELRTEDIGTEVFFLPAAAHTEKDGASPTPSGCSSGTRRRWSPRATAARSCGSSTTWAAHPRASWPARRDPRDRPMLDLTWDYPLIGPHERARRGGGAAGDQRAATPTGVRVRATRSCKRRRLHGLRVVDPRGHATPTASTSPRGAGPGSEQNWVAPEWGWAWPANRRILYNRASADPEGTPVVRAQALRVVGRRGGPLDRARRPADFTPRQAARLRARARTRRGLGALRGDDPFIIQADGLGWLFAPTGLVDGPLPTHYEPHESPVRATRSTGSRPTRCARRFAAAGEPVQPDGRRAGQRTCSPTS